MPEFPIESADDLFKVTAMELGVMRERILRDGEQLLREWSEAHNKASETGSNSCEDKGT